MQELRIKIVDGSAQHLPEALRLVHQLAAFEKEEDQVTATLDDYGRGFDDGLFKFLVAQQDQKVVGIMIYYYTWSTWKGKMMYLEDFVVDSDHRRKGIGEQLMDRLIEVAQENKCTLIKWQVLNWNESGIRFYEKMGNAVFDKKWWDVKVYLT